VEEDHTGSVPVVNRRAVFSGLVAAAIIPKAEAAMSPAEQVESDAKALAASMRALHGGEWDVRIDHAQQLVLVISQ
jgi:hypothetical protein